MEIRKANSRELRQMKRLYLEAFPLAERKPFGLMKRKAKKGEMELLAIVDGSQFVGLAITVLYNDKVLLDYFAICRAFRGKKYGSEALQILLNNYQDKRMIFEIELAGENADESDDKVRRKRFYLRNGLKETGIHIRLFGVPMEILTEGKPITYEEYHEVYDYIIGSTYASKVVKLQDEGQQYA